VIVSDIVSVESVV